MKLKHGDFWDHVLVFVSEAHDECSRMVKAGKLGGFEKTWLDPTVRLSGYTWFADAKPVAKKLAEASIKNQVREMIEYYRFAEKLLGSESG